MKVGYEISFTRYFYKPQPMRTLEEIRADILELEKETEGLPRRDRRSPTAKTGKKTACVRRHFSDRRLRRRRVQGAVPPVDRQICPREMTLALSDLTLRELEAAPERVREILDVVPPKHTEVIKLSEEAEVLAAQYIERGVLSSRMLADALHIAAATVARVDVLVSWNFRHVVNLRRIQALQRSEPRHGIRGARHPHPEGDLR